MDLTRARAILAELDGGDIDANDPDQLDDWADRIMRDRDKDSAGEMMATGMAARLRVLAERQRGQTS